MLSLTAETEAELAENAYVAEFDGQVVGFVGFQDVEEAEVNEFRCVYNVDAVVASTAFHNFSQVSFFVLNPIFNGCRRKMLQVACTLQGATACFLQNKVNGTEPVSAVCREMISVVPRAAPALLNANAAGADGNSASKKQPLVFSKLPLVESNQEKGDTVRNEILSRFADKSLNLVTARILSEPKAQINARIVVVGASNTGLAFLQTLCESRLLQFNNVTLVASNAGALFDSTDGDSSSSSSTFKSTSGFDVAALRRLQFEMKVRVLATRMKAIDRVQNSLELEGGVMLPYDHLVLACGLQDSTLNVFGPSNNLPQGALSISDPSLTRHLHPEGTFVKSLIWNPLSYAAVYGDSLDVFSIVQALLDRKVPRSKIVLVVPPKGDEAEALMRDDKEAVPSNVESRLHGLLEALGICIYRNMKLKGLNRDGQGRLVAAVLEDCNAPGTEAGDGGSSPMRQLNYTAGGGKGGIRECTLNARVLITANGADVDPDVFDTINSNGLVYDGRLVSYLYDVGAVLPPIASLAVFCGITLFTAPPM